MVRNNMYLHCFGSVFLLSYPFSICTCIYVYTYNVIWLLTSISIFVTWLFVITFCEIQSFNMFNIFLVRFFIAVMKHHDHKTTRGRKSLLIVHLSKQWRQQLREGQEFGARADAVAMEGAAYWLTPHCSLSVPFY